MTLRVSDHCGRMHEDDVLIIVQDTTPPEIDGTPAEPPPRIANPIRLTTIAKTTGSATK